MSRSESSESKSTDSLWVDSESIFWWSRLKWVFCGHFRANLRYYGSNSQFLLMTLSFWSILSWFSNYIICFEGFKQNCVFHYQNLIFESIGHLLRTELESKVEWVESISYDSLGVSRVEKFRLTLNTSFKKLEYGCLNKKVRSFYPFFRRLVPVSEQNPLTWMKSQKVQR